MKSNDDDDYQEPAQNSVMMAQNTVSTMVTMIQELRDENAALRLQYMMNKIDEESFRISVGKKLKKREKNHEVHQIFDMFVNTMIILFNNMMIDGEDSRTLVQDSFKNMDILRKYTNKELNKVADIYECKLDNITDDWVLGKRITMVID